jgi:anhydro-N-acetylmuramic acid kinase
MRAIGLMSGTSLDGVDVAVIETDGERIAALGPSGYRPYTEAERDLLRQALTAGAGLTDRTARPGPLGAAERLITEAHGEAIGTLMAQHAIAAGSIDIIGFHGQTVLHRPERHLTVQIGDARALAQRCGIPVAYDFRAADVAAGGQGAPFVPVFHRAVAATIDRPRPLVVLNVGGVANITYLDDDADPIACDTGPGNALLDDFMRLRTGKPHDDGGAVAAQGRVDQAFLARMLAHPFFAAPPPKSLDRNEFALAGLGLDALSVADGAATLAALTAATVARIVPHLPRPPASFIVAGGGAKNRTLLAMLRERLAPAQVETATEVGWSADALEAQAFAYLAVRSRLGLPLTFPRTTGVPRPLTGGVIVAPA